MAGSAHEEIELDLNLLKIAVQTGDAESYVNKVAGVMNEKARIEGLFMVRDEQAEYVGLVNEYLTVLDGKETMVGEMKNLKEEVAGIVKTLQENFGNKDEISRDLFTLSHRIRRIDGTVVFPIHRDDAGIDGYFLSIQNPFSKSSR